MTSSLLRTSRCERRVRAEIDSGSDDKRLWLSDRRKSDWRRVTHSGNVAKSLLLR